MPEENLRDIIEDSCRKVLNEMNMTENQMCETSLRLAQFVMSESSKAMFEKIKEEAKKGVPDDLEKAYLQAFLAGYNCGMGDQQRKRW